MVVRMRYVAVMMASIIFGFLGWRVYVYFLDTSKPYLELEGVVAQGYYAGDMQCRLMSSKSGEVSIWLDDQPLANRFKISGGGTGHSFTIPTKPITNGKHTLRVQICDRTYHRNSSVLEREFYADNMSLQAALIKSDTEYRVLQGRTLHVQFQVNKAIKNATMSLLSHTYDCFPESKNSLVYEVFVPIPCEETPNEYLFSIAVNDHTGNTVRLDNKFQVVLYPFKKQLLRLSNAKINEEQSLGQDNRSFEERIERLTQESPHEKLWKGLFTSPIEIQRITTEFGTIRTTQHKGLYAHKALDVTNLPRSVVWATQDGVVVLKERFGFSGNTVVLDHGMGVLSIFFHLDDFARIKEGEKIAKGEPVGYIGKTGYASGYHLHWEMRINNIQIDPMQWTKAIF